MQHVVLTYQTQKVSLTLPQATEEHEEFLNLAARRLMMSRAALRSHLSPSNLFLQGLSDLEFLSSPFDRDQMPADQEAIKRLSLWIPGQNREGGEENKHQTFLHVIDKDQMLCWNFFPLLPEFSSFYVRQESSSPSILYMARPNSIGELATSVRRHLPAGADCHIRGWAVGVQHCDVLFSLLVRKHGRRIKSKISKLLWKDRFVVCLQILEASTFETPLNGNNEKGEQLTHSLIKRNHKNGKENEDETRTRTGPLLPSSPSHRPAGDSGSASCRTLGLALAFLSVCVLLSSFL